MSVKVYIRKILEYDPTYGGKYDKYDGYCLITLQKLDPTILPRQKCSIDIPAISPPVYCSSLNRGVKTAEVYFDKEVILPIDELKEIRFDLQRLLTNDEYQKYGSSLVRERFVEAFISDSLLESRNNIKLRINAVLEKLERLGSGEYLIISHSFFMKILQCFLKESNLFDEPELLWADFDTSRKTYIFGHGFTFTLAARS